MCIRDSHSANGRLMCHYCGHSEPLPDACPSCGGALNFLGYGTQKVEEELHAAFPGREILRMDTDTVSATQSHEKLLSRFEKERIPVLVGTQMVAKGLDFENVTLVGVISADPVSYTHLDVYKRQVPVKVYLDGSSEVGVVGEYNISISVSRS